METTLESTSELEREHWVDFVRASAIFFVVLLHSAAPWVLRFGLTSDFNWQVGNIIDSLTRVAVPVFFMTTGYLLLTRPISLKSYFNKRFRRIAVPWLVWSIIFLIYKKIRLDIPITISEGFFEILNGDVYFHFWFLYTLIGLYLIIPVISWFIESDPQKRSFYFLTVWFITASIIPMLNTLSKNIANHELAIAFDLRMFGGFSGYLIAGFLIGKFKPSKSQWVLFLGVFAMSTIVTIVATSVGTYRLERLIEYFYDYAAPNVILASFAAFAVLKRIGIAISQNEKVSLIFSRIGFASLGIYLIHPIFINALNDGMFGPDLKFIVQNSALTIPIVAVITFFLSYIVVEVFLRIPVIRRIV